MHFVMFDHFIETADAARGQRVDRAGADAIDADFFGRDRRRDSVCWLRARPWPRP